MADQAFFPNPRLQAKLDFTPLSDRLDQAWYSTVVENLRDALFPPQQPPLHLTSKPVRVRSIWGAYDNKKQASVGSMIVHACMIGALVYISVTGARVVTEPRKVEHITYIPTPPPQE